MPQGRPLDWPSYGGDARRTGWQRSDTRITKDNVKDFQLVLKKKLDGAQAGPHSLTAPVVIGLLISYKGFKELGFVSNTAGDLWAIDLDLNRVFWKKRFEGAGTASGPCSSMAAIPALTPPMTFGGARRRPPARTGGTNTPSPGQPPTTAGRTTERPTAARIVGSGFGAPRPAFLVSSDGKLHQVNSSDGSDQFPPLDFLPANAKASSLTLHDNVMYATTSGGCGGTSDGVYAIDLAEEVTRPVNFPLNGGDAAGLGGFALGTDGTVYVQTGAGAFDSSSNKWSNTLLSLSPRDLKLKGYFSLADNGTGAKTAPHLNTATPVVFDFKGRELVVSTGNDGRLYLLDSETIGGSDHKTALSQTGPVAAANGGIWGGLSSWEDEAGVRWVAAPVWGSVSPDLKVPGTNGPAPNGSIVAFRVEEQGGKPVLTPAWVSCDLNSPVPPVITSGMVFALSTGGYTRQGSALKPKGGARAALYAFDAATGKEMYSTANQVSAPGSLTGLTIANGRVFFTTVDNTLYGFGIHLEI
jgi:hypothetical protein